MVGGLIGRCVSNISRIRNEFGAMIKVRLKRCGRSCRIRWTNYPRPDLKNDNFTTQEEDLIIKLHATIGSGWSIIAQQLLGRTDTDVKNYWNTKLKKKLSQLGIDLVTHKPFSKLIADYGNIGGCQKPSTRIASINKDFKNAMMLKSESHQALPEGFITNINDQPKPPPKMETTGNNFLFNRIHGDDLLMNLDQFQAISMKSEANMEEVEQANRVAVESCHRVLSLLSQPRDQVQRRNLMVETSETVVRFKKVVSMLHNGLGHARVRKLKNPQIPSSHQSIFLDNPNCKTLTNNNNNHHSKKNLYFPQIN
ncbi:hypothetical protein JHK87_050398 [Glycine soja]|nr:hypothetical protein JHK87_050398 [Glycine soja]